jgi:hypothetical protein
MGNVGLFHPSMAYAKVQTRMPLLIGSITLQRNADENWMLAGDFNFYRSVLDRNRDRGNMNDIMIFNEIISNLGLIEIPLKGRNFTWNNM